MHSRQSVGNSATGEDEISSTREERTLETEMRSLPPTDHGRDAYLVLVGCTIIQAPVWGEQVALQLTVSSHLRTSRLFALFWGVPGILHDPQQHQGFSRRDRYRWNYLERSYVSDDAAFFHAADSLSPTSTVLWTYGLGYHRL